MEQTEQNRSHGSDPTSIILESISDGVFTVDKRWRISSYNRAAEAITGIQREEAIGKRCWEVFRSSMCEDNCALRHTMKTGTPVVNRSGFIIDAHGNRIPISVSTALLKDENGNVIGGAETFRDLTLIHELRRELEGKYRVGDMVSRSHAMKRLFDILPQLAASDSTILIQGETGTGKELFARAVHDMSHRKTKPFVALNCGALPDTLLESELFGYEPGAFTGAEKRKPGRFALAEGGTLFLDEIGEVSPAMQVRLLRVLQDKKFEPLGSVKSVVADVRIIAASNKPIARLVEAGTFRADLFYRINVVTIELPPLRHRKEDIPLLIDHFVQRFNRLQAKSIKGVSPDTLAILMAYHYPGNIRELENVIEHAFVLCTGDTITLDHLPEQFGIHRFQLSAPQHLDAAVKAIEAQVIQDALTRNQYNRLAAAKELGIHKSTLFRKIQALGIPLPQIDGRSRVQKHCPDDGL